MRFTRAIRFASPALGPRFLAGAIGASGHLLSHIDFRLHWRVCDALGMLASGANYDCVVQIAADSWMKLSLADPYWSRLVASRYEYEPDFASFVRGLTELSFDVIDGGANYGYWSIMLSSECMGRRRVVAIEPAATTFAWLAENCRLNDHRFQCLRRALSDETGRKVVIDDSGGHSGAHVAVDRVSEMSPGAAVETITLDDVAASAFGDIPERVIVKLDVEGHEIQALRGARRLLAEDALVYYEDHGGDPSSNVTRFVIEQLGLEVFYRRVDGTSDHIRSAADASRVKKQPTRGYNFFACRNRSSFLPWLSP